MSQIYHRSNRDHNQVYQRILEQDQQHYSPRETPEETQRHMSQEQEETHQIEMVIQFGNNSSGTIIVNAQDDPTTMAKLFCFKHNLSPHVIPTLANNIRSLQLSTFHQPQPQQQSSLYIQDKENSNTCNLPSRKRSNQKIGKNSRLVASRSRTNQSMINESMRMSTGHQSGSGCNVFQRLYRDSRKKKSSSRVPETGNNSKRSESRASLPSQNKSLNQSSMSGCLRIYDKNTKMKEDSQLHHKRVLEARLQREVEGCSFQPQINPLSSLIASKLRQLDESSILNRTGDKNMLKIKEYLLQKEQQEMKECTFKPKIINKIAQNHVNSKPNRILYESKKMVSDKRSKEEKASYHPQINNISKAIVKKDFFERLDQDASKRQEKKRSNQKLGRSKSVERRPSIGRPPTARNLGDKTIGQYLYEKSRMSGTLTTKEQPRVMTNPKSSLIHAKSKQIAIQYIFELLDHDQDGLISSTKINIGVLSQEILRLLAPLLSQMQEVGVELNHEQFSIAFDRLYSTFSIDEKNVIVKSYKNKSMGSKVSEKSTFNPTLNEQSLRIARQLCSDDVDIYQSSLMRMRQKQNKLNRLRAERVLQEYSECTFHPKIYR